MMDVIVVFATEPEDVRLDKVRGVQTPAQTLTHNIEFLVHVQTEETQQAPVEPALAAMVRYPAAIEEEQAEE
jgi:hypothetical protein